ncbi:MAG TPA: TIM barrel protein [Nocardioidaceae bacterium]|nr:TIM barrel protein [Nocardioidaceae bacterium]
MPTELLATCWTHAGDAMPVDGHHLSPVDLRVRAEAVAAAGFTGIGFTIGDLDAALATHGLPQIRQICDDLGLVHREVELLEDWWTTGALRRASDQVRASLLNAAAALGARTVKIGPDVRAVDGVVPPLTDVEHWAAELHQLAVEAAEAGTRVALEPLPFANITDFRVAADLVAAADHPAAGLVVDIWHLERGPSTLADLAEVPGDKVFVVELNDAPVPQSADLFQDTIHHRVLCGAGTFDVRGFVETLRRIGFAGPWGVEIISDTHRQGPLLKALTDAYRTTMDVFDDAAAQSRQATRTCPAPDVQQVPTPASRREASSADTDT